MIDYINLAKTYGGFTTLDSQYLNVLLTGLTHDQKLKVITPPPSVINAYFAEMYQKQGPRAATDYYFQLTQALELYQDQPSFKEFKPFVRLNLAGESYGFSYEKGQEIARVFAEKETTTNETLLFQLAEIFPHYVIYQEENTIKMQELTFNNDNLKELNLPEVLLSRVFVGDNLTLIKGYNADEVSQLAKNYPGKSYYQFHQRECIIYQVN
ncbi:cystathionine beta-lyase [Streptococcus uberis]|uniref:cystathionine beta-lyase n=1 Tax=Streptococcus uberis TaxID=1349 RepID=UPI0019398C5E|nr:cystathionine beta-lyase [Streptococcus uberis]